MATLGIKCKVCDKGPLEKTKLYRLSIPVVVIGYIFLLPSLLGIFISGMMFFGSVIAVGEGANETKDKTIKQLISVGMNLDDAENILRKSESEVDDYLSTSGQYTDEQVSEIKSSLSSYTYGNAGAGLGFLMLSGMTLPFLILSITSGLVGWLLTMKKKVLKCISCEAVINAS